MFTKPNIFTVCSFMGKISRPLLYENIVSIPILHDRYLNLRELNICSRTQSSSIENCVYYPSEFDFKRHKGLVTNERRWVFQANKTCYMMAMKSTKNCETPLLWEGDMSYKWESLGYGTSVESRSRL